jgi:hypothetical protein
MAPAHFVVCISGSNWESPTRPQTFKSRLLVVQAPAILLLFNNVIPMVMQFNVDYRFVFRYPSISSKPFRCFPSRISSCWKPSEMANSNALFRFAHYVRRIPSFYEPWVEIGVLDVCKYVTCRTMVWSIIGIKRDVTVIEIESLRNPRWCHLHSSGTRAPASTASRAVSLPIWDFVHMASTAPVFDSMAIEWAKLLPAWVRYSSQHFLSSV